MAERNFNPQPWSPVEGIALGRPSDPTFQPSETRDQADERSVMGLAAELKGLVRDDRAYRAKRARNFR